MCEAEAPEATAQMRLGLVEGPGNLHPGQGTACRRFFFLRQLCLPRTSYVLRRLGFRAFSDSLQSCRPSSFRCSTRCDVSSSRASRCIWKSSRSATSWPSSIDRVARVFASRRPIESFGHGSRTPGPAGTRPFTSSSQRRSSLGIGAGFACSGPGRADTAPDARLCHTTFAP
jgi:hypothetical protein